MLIEIKYYSFIDKLEQTLKEVFDDKYDYLYYNEEEHKFEQLEIPYKDFFAENSKYIPLTDILGYIMDTPSITKILWIKETNKSQSVFPLNIDNIFLVDGLLKQAGRSFLKHDINKLIACTFNDENDILSIEFE